MHTKYKGCTFLSLQSISAPDLTKTSTHSMRPTKSHTILLALAQEEIKWNPLTHLLISKWYLPIFIWFKDKETLVYLWPNLTKRLNCMYKYIVHDLPMCAAQCNGFLSFLSPAFKWAPLVIRSCAICKTRISKFTQE